MGVRRYAQVNLSEASATPGQSKYTAWYDAFGFQRAEFALSWLGFVGTFGLECQVASARVVQLPPLVIGEDYFGEDPLGVSTGGALIVVANPPAVMRVRFTHDAAASGAYELHWIVTLT